MSIETNKACRICLSEADELEPIFGSLYLKVPIVDIIKKVCYSLTLTPKEIDDPRLPYQLCLECMDVLCKAHKLNELSVQSEKQLLLQLSQECFIKQESIEYEAETESNLMIEKLEIKEDFNESLHDDDYMEYTKTELAEEEAEDDTSPEDSHGENKKKRRKRNATPKRHKCSTCSKMFEKPSKLLRHEQTHDVNKKPFACEFPECFQRFATQASLKRHAIMHSGMTIKVVEEKTFKCFICSKEFPIQEALASHMRSHKTVMDQLEFPCNLCDKKFKKLNDLTRHSRIHPENKSHKCLICSKMFSQGSHLIDHLNRHNGLKPHSCHICNKGKA